VSSSQSAPHAASGVGIGGGSGGGGGAGGGVAVGGRVDGGATAAPKSRAVASLSAGDGVSFSASPRGTAVRVAATSGDVSGPSVSIAPADASKAVSGVSRCWSLVCRLQSFHMAHILHSCVVTVVVLWCQGAQGTPRSITSQGSGACVLLPRLSSREDVVCNEWLLASCRA
jgi:hypothetical protein